MNNIGRCCTCQNLFCNTPKIKQLHPHLGCAEWTTAQAKATARKIKTIVIELVKD